MEGDDIKHEGSAMGVDDNDESVIVDAFSTLSTRKDLDFTERFWKFCQNAQNQDDLIDALTAVIEELETGRLRPMIHKENHSNLGNLIRDCIKLTLLQTTADHDEQRETIGRAFDYWLASPLECLCEVGMFKLRRDYCFYLVGEW
ncbi:hypothetical protein BC936DRAFT_139596 [Jimgerdemannia flammicorona]|uniref:Uncharacterized protein n=1 Tax=Jimgerdemannia flammicorona TaxID=994334 RepID=A0A433DHR7_9FUNG|nr:hypothetical protein BC936DRAFT_139596 [Jimgerdemannia flammicorona]